MKFVCGTQNKAKLESVKMALARCKFTVPAAAGCERMASSDGGEDDGHDRHEVVGAINIASGVGAQPLTAGETRAGALARAKAALLSDPSADFGVGLEGGIEHVDDSGDFFECGWICVVHRSGRVGWGSSARFLIDESIVDQLRAGKELAEVMDEMTGEQDVRSNAGAMGVLTGGALNRAEAYSHGVIFAFAPFLSGEQYWTVSRQRNVVDLDVQPGQQQPAAAAAGN